VTRDLPFTAAGRSYVAVAHPLDAFLARTWRCVAVHTMPDQRLVGCGFWSRGAFEAFDKLPAAVVAVLPRVLGELGDA
jgi:hypothetical protein